MVIENTKCQKQNVATEVSLTLVDIVVDEFVPFPKEPWSIFVLTQYLQVSVEFSRSMAEPSKKINLTVKADPGSKVNILAVDKSVLLLKSGNDITKDQVLADFILQYYMHFDEVILRTGINCLYTCTFSCVQNKWKFLYLNKSKRKIC